MDVYAEYRMKLRTADQAAALVKSGDWVDYASNIACPWTRRWPGAGMS